MMHWALQAIPIRAAGRLIIPSVGINRMHSVDDEFKIVDSWNYESQCLAESAFSPNPSRSPLADLSCMNLCMWSPVDPCLVTKRRIQASHGSPKRRVRSLAQTAERHRQTADRHRRSFRRNGHSLAELGLLTSSWFLVTNSLVASILEPSFGANAIAHKT
jgi:hypothetical protein